MTGNRSELAVGGTVLAALGVLLFSTFRVGACAWMQPEGMQLHARFDNAAGVEPRTDLMIAGVKVGEVAGVDLEEGRARVTLRVEDPRVEVPADSTVSIRSRGMLGERVVEIVPGGADHLLSDGDTLTRVAEAPNIDAILENLASLSDDVKSVTRSMRLVLGGAEGEETVAQIVGDIRSVTGNLRRFIDDNEEKLARTLTNFDDISQDLGSFSSDLADLSSENDETVGQMLENLAQTSTKLGEAMENIAVVSQRVEQGEGTLGKLLSDEDLYTKVDASVTELKQTLTEVRRAAEDAQEQLPVTVLGSLVGSLF